MSLRLGALHDALLDPGNVEKAQKAAEELANYESQFAEIKATQKVHTALLSINTAVGIAILMRVFFG